MQNLQPGYSPYPIVKSTMNLGKTLVDVTNANFMYTHAEQHTNNGTISIHNERFALGTITKVVHRKYDPKFGVMCIWNTQLLHGKFTSEEIANLNQSATRLYFKTLDPDEKRYISQCLQFYNFDEEMLDILRKKWCIARGSFVSNANTFYEDTLLVLEIPKIQ